jgi:hypothetical protein
MQLFGGVYGDATPPSRSKFDTFWEAVLTLFIVCSGENTFTVGWDLAEASGTKWAVAYVAAWSLVSTSLLALVLGVLIQATSEPVVLDEEAGSDVHVDEREPETQEESPRELQNNQSISLFPSASANGSSRSRTGTPRAGDAPSSPVSIDGVSFSTDAETEAKRAEELEKEFAAARANAEVEVAAVRLWLDENGFSVRQRKVIRVEVVDGCLRRSVTRSGETADDVRGRFTEEELRDARDRITNLRRLGKFIDRESVDESDSDGFDDHRVHRVESNDSASPKPAAWGLGGRPMTADDKVPQAIRFGIGATSKVMSAAALLKQKAKAREEKIREERRVKAMDPDALRRERTEARAAEVGIDLEKERARWFCLTAVEHRYSRNFVLSLIVVSACLLAPQCDKDWPREGSAAEKPFAGVDYFFTAAFAVEMCMKITAYTALSGPRAYFKDGWNVLDGFIVCMSLLTVALASVAGGLGGNLKVFRVLRVLRPLRVIKNVPSLRLIIDATLVSLPSILTVCTLGMVTFVILGVLGMSLFRGMFRACSVPGNDGGDIQSCEALGGEFMNAPLHFDNIGQAIVAVFVMSFGDNWQDVMFLGMDTVGELREPMVENRKEYAFFFILTVVVAFFFWANLFVSSLVDNFTRVASEIGGEDGGDEAFSGAGYAYSESQRKWLVALKSGWLAAAEAWRDENPLAMPLYRRSVFRVRKSRFWEPFVTLCIASNAAQLCLYRADASDAETKIMTLFSVVFCALYVLETAVNVIAMRWSTYWESGWHKLDFAVTVSGVFELAVLFAIGEENAGFVTVFRTIRFFRLFKLLKTSPGLRSLVDTFITALPGMLNVLGLMVLVMHIYACLGCALYGDIPEPYPGDGLTRYTNFQNWGNAVSLLFVSLSGNWVEVFKDVYWECATGDDISTRTAEDCARYRFSAIFYFFSFVVFAVYLVVNLLVAILIERFDYCSTMEGVYDKQDPFDALVRLNVLRKFGTKMRNRLKLVRMMQRAETKQGRSGVDVEQYGFGTENAKDGDGGVRFHPTGIFGRRSNSRQSSFTGANERLLQLVRGPRLRAFQTLKQSLAAALQGFGSVPDDRAMELVQSALDADSESQEQERLEKERLPSVYAAAGAEVVAKDSDESDDDKSKREANENAKGVFGAIRNAFASSAKASPRR